MSTTRANVSSGSAATSLRDPARFSATSCSYATALRSNEAAGSFRVPMHAFLHATGARRPGAPPPAMGGMIVLDVASAH